MKNNKFRSGVNKYIFVALGVYHLMIIIPFILMNFLWRDVITWYAYTLLVIDVVFLLPLIFNTYYSLEDYHLFVYQWPFSRIKINYSDIFIIDNEFPADVEKKYRKKYGFSTKFIVIGYYAEKLDRKDKKVKKVKSYIAISPADYDAFMIRIGSKFTMAKQLAEKLEKARAAAEGEKDASAENKKDKQNSDTKKSPKLTETVVKLDALKKKKPKAPEKPKDEDIIIASGVKNVKVKIIEDDKPENKDNNE